MQSLVRGMNYSVLAWQLVIRRGLQEIVRSYICATIFLFVLPWEKDLEIFNVMTYFGLIVCVCFLSSNRASLCAVELWKNAP